MKLAIVTGFDSTVFAPAGRVVFVGLLLGASVLPAHAQSVAPASAASAPAKNVAPSERAQQQADNVFRWIKVHADKPRKASDNKLTGKSKAPIVVDTDAAPVVAAVPNPGAVEVNPPAEKIVDPVPLVVTASNAPASVPANVPALVAAVPKPAETEVALKLIEQVEPEFPANVMASLGKGSVKVRFNVQTDGSVSEPEVLASSHRRLNRAAIDAVSKWRFEPVRAVRSAQVEVGFDLD